MRDRAKPDWRLILAACMPTVIFSLAITQIDGVGWGFMVPGLLLVAMLAAVLYGLPRASADADRD